MAYDYQLLHAITRKGALVLLLVFSLADFARAERLTMPVATALRATVSGNSTRITIAGTAPMAYSVRRPSEHLLVVELPGVDASKLAPSYQVSSPLVSSLTVKHSTLADAGTSARLEIALRATVQERSRMEDNDLVLEIMPGRADNNGGAAALSPSNEISETSPSRATPNTASQNPSVAVSGSSNSAPQSQQGAQYGQPNFVGEPINLNVVNADIRDILNYITEQYGVNFVIDSSVRAVPVTVNVTEVPWNIALDAILKANRLGIEARGNILRVATTEVLAGEAATEAQISEARLNGAPLVTEFVRLNYARASGTLQDAAGASGGFSGGVTSGSASSGSASESGGGSSGTDQGILPIIRRRLSRRGAVEVDGRSNTLIITDVKENIASIKQLIGLLDQPEPQVEIETRIVIANRNFSRDLGVQLSAVALNASRGAIGSFETLPNTNVGTQPLGIPGGLNGSPSAASSLGATAASTVIGLTTGIFGTAQISALITAAEVKGQAKIVATPRVTALNNRPAQIESGTQIPVVTPQTSSGGGAVFTTTFVSVPLRLSITPQITDAGTVVLRVVTENNSINLGLTNSLGTPGIDTQRMQTEVLVPDGGTTVVGGVLADNEGETQNRTPGLAGIPLLGNLFKRRSVTRQTNEILFFITPRIYRPDFAGRPTGGTVSDHTRSVSIPQPVPLGNPPTNTTAPNTQYSPTRSNQVDLPSVTGRSPVTESNPGVRP